MGFEKIARQQAQLQQLRIAILDSLRIRNCFKAPQTQEGLAETVPEVAELDLGRNLFETLDEIAGITSQLPQLRSLSLDGNRIQSVSNIDSQDLRPAFNGIRTLSLNDMLLLPHELRTIVAQFPNLSELSASGNDLGEDLAVEVPETLATVTLEGNNFMSLNDVFCLGCQQGNARNIHTLVLKNNNIREVIRHTNNGLSNALYTWDASGDLICNNKPFAFHPALTTLDLSHNSISDWSLLNALPHLFPGLKHLRISHNPLYSSLKAANRTPLTPADGYMLTIARLPKLQTLNYSTITEKERLNAETYYLSQIAEEVSLAPPEMEGEIKKRHPRWHALCEEYGEPVIVRKMGKGIDPNSLAARLIRCQFYCATPCATDVSEKEFFMELPKSLSIYAVLGIVGKRLGLLPLKLRLFWETGEKDPVKTAGGKVQGVQEWDSDEEETTEDKRVQWVEREVELVAGTRPLGTVVEKAEARLRVEWTVDAVYKAPL